MAQKMLGTENDVDIVDFSISQSPDAFSFTHFSGYHKNKLTRTNVLLIKKKNKRHCCICHAERLCVIVLPTGYNPRRISSFMISCMRQ